MFDLRGKTALITGASGGIGAAIAQSFWQQGANLVISGTNPERLEKTAQSLRDGHAEQKQAQSICQLGDAQAIQNLAEEAEALTGRVDILINNAGVTRDNLFVRLKDEDFTELLQINLLSAIRLSRAVLRGMMKARWGRIINISSVVGFTGNPGQTNYVASKAAMVGFSKSLAAEIASRHVTVNCIAPGFIATPMTEKLTPEQKAAITANIPAQRLGEGADIAAAACYLASEESGYMTGQVLHVNGGLAMV